MFVLTCILVVYKGCFRAQRPWQFFIPTGVCWEVMTLLHYFHRLVDSDLGEAISETRDDSEGLFYSSIFVTVYTFLVVPVRLP